MPLRGRVVAAPPGVHGFDANTVLNRRVCEVAKARGFEFCIRYVSRRDVQPHETMIAYCNKWFAEVQGAGFVPGVYVGARAILTGNELFWRLSTKHYWKSGSRVPDIPHRGYQLIQTIIRNDKIDGVAIDRNLTKNDNFGGSVLWLSAS
jgi:hypothetical protein